MPIINFFFSAALCWPLVLSTFSHYSFLHLAANMYVLHSFSEGTVAALGKEQFVGLYMAAGCISSLTSLLYKSVFGVSGLSLGASGAIMAIIGYVCTAYPDTDMSLIFLPFVHFKAHHAIKAIMTLDAAGILFKWQFFDHAAHLGGAIVGIGWYYYGNYYIWQNRKYVVQAWHDFRSSFD
ncbi:presenilins-associated rhomboid-like protein, mitochondrial isoform X1 [Lycorma delicatula]|uniref:presenilins-associated rhomboid-like protein, mitochondrial isoform X1 n=1 Tax=Lycorma delicatula TaxID=130591 RepID=UPI003F51892C